MTRARKQQISLDATPYYHCVTRCVRQSFICGVDKATGRSYEHRRVRIERDVLRLASIFYIDIASFAIMSNHYHLVLHINKPNCLEATPQDIAKRWHQLFKGTDVSTKFINGESVEGHEIDHLDALIDTWRIRLHSISWFMKVLNEGVARAANKEDNCKGHFWEARFKSQALLDEKALLSAMAYVDLNPVRARMAATPEQSDHTSIKLRIEYWKSKVATHNGSSVDSEGNNDETMQPKSLLVFIGNERKEMPITGIVFNLLDYIELVDWTGRQIRENKRGAIDVNAPPALQRLNISPKHWVELTTNFESRFKVLVGTATSLKEKIGHLKLHRKANYRNSVLLFGYQ